jgi:lipopolysaccharide export LptBFGC system permease protein LptF
LFLFALAGAAVLFVLEDRVLAESTKKAKMLRNDILDDPARRLNPTTINLSSHNWLIGEDRRVYHYTFFEQPSRANNHQATLRDLSAFERTPDGLRLTSHLYASRARFDGSIWHLERGWIHRFDTEPALRAEFDAQTMSLARVDDFRRAQVDPSGMTVRQSWEYVRKLAAGGYNVTDQLVNLHRKIAFPFVTIVMTLLAIPFGVTVGRKGTLYGIGLAAVLGAVYFLMMTVFVAIGAAGLLPAWLAAWGTNIIFIAGAVYLVLTVRT